MKLKLSEPATATLPSEIAADAISELNACVLEASTTKPERFSVLRASCKPVAVHESLEMAASMIASSLILCLTAMRSESEPAALIVEPVTLAEVSPSMELIESPTPSPTVPDEPLIAPA